MKALLTLSVSIGALAATGALAQAGEARPMVDWVIPALPTNTPQTPQQAEDARKAGRELPPPEILQPRLDPALPAYQARKEKLSGTFKGGASDVLVVLVQKWLEKFQARQPGVKLSISPPYAGSLGAAELAKENLDFVFVSRELRPADVHAVQARFNYDPLCVPVCAGTSGRSMRLRFSSTKTTRSKSSPSSRLTPSTRARDIAAANPSPSGGISALPANGQISRSRLTASSPGMASRNSSASASSAKKESGASGART